VRGATVHGAASVRIDTDEPLVAGHWNTPSVDGRRVALLFARRGDQLWLQVDGIDVAFTDLRLQPPERAQLAAGAGAIAAAMHGRVVAVAVAAGERVERGAALATLEAMKMEHTLAAPAGGRVRVVRVRTGEQVAAGDVMIELELDAPQAAQQE
jgi:geranyl-CoA carboxylase alpha subunit